MNASKTIAVVGATGLVGRTILTVLQKYGFDDWEVIACASQKSIGAKLEYGTRELTVTSVEEAIKRHPRYAIFSAGATASRQYAPLFASVDTVVVDNSSAWRMEKDVPLVVPSINMNSVSKETRIIANPNCSTIQMVMALSPLHSRYKIHRIVVSTYQSVTGTGVKAVRQLEKEEAGENCPDSMAYQYPIHHNVIPLGGSYLPNGYTTEEQKLVDETRKILDAPSIQVSATVVRVPVLGGHSESVNVEFEEEYELEDIFNILRGSEGIVVQDDPANNIYPMPLFAQGTDKVYVGRIRRDYTQPRTLNLWIVADNLRIGAAYNAVRIVQQHISNQE